MNFLPTFVHTPLAETIGWTLLHSVWQGAIVSGLLAAMLAVVRSPRIRYVAACLAMLFMLGAFGMTFIRRMPEAGHSTASMTMPRAMAWNASPAYPAVSARPDLGSYVPWLAPFWLAGMSLIYLWWVADCVFVHRLRQRGVCSAPTHWQERIASLGAQLHISKPVLLLESCLTEVPVVVGHFRPLILLPVGLLTGIPAEQVEAILLHELAHISRHDYLVNVLQRLAEGLFFYHPAIWWISRVMRTERENCCDDAAVHVTGDVYRYARALTVLEEYRQSAVQPAVAATGGNLVKRIHRLLYPAKPIRNATPFLAAAIFVTATAVSLVAWQAKPSQTGHPSFPLKHETAGSISSETPNKPVPPLVVAQLKPAETSSSALQTQPEALNPVYSSWLNQDVAYIMDSAERVAFLRLTSDEDRNKFIERFWLNRDPTPDTPKNEFKEEHYRRLAYTNRHLASDKPGWQTDRGRAYIVYGPPQEVKAYPSGGAQHPQPFEIWRYKQDSGIKDVTFVDRTRNGNYERQPEGAE